MVEPVTGWVPQLYSSKRRLEVAVGWTTGGVNVNWMTVTPPVQYAAGLAAFAVLAVFVVFAVFAALAVPGASSPASDTIAARTDINSLRGISRLSFFWTPVPWRWVIVDRCPRDTRALRYPMRTPLIRP
jgi:hypothetical protein